MPIAAWSLVAATALARDPESATPATRADEVLAAIRAEDADQLRSLAAAADPDPWIVADELCRRGTGDAARRFALATPVSPDLEALRRFVEERTASSLPRSIADALRGAAAAADRQALVSAIESARDVTSPFERARLAYALALGLRGFDREEAAAAFVTAAGEAERIGWLRRTDEALGGAGYQLAAMAKYNRAREVWRIQLDVQRRRLAGDRAANCLQNLASIDTLVGDYPAACASFEEAVREMSALGERCRRDSINALLNLANARARAGQYAKALAACRRAIDLVAAKGEDDLRANVLLVEGNVQLALADPERAETAHRRALAASETAGDPELTGLCRATLGNDLRERGDIDAAIAIFEAALEPLTQPDQQALALRITINLTSVLSARGDYRRARECGTRAAALAEALHEPPMRANALQNLARACRGAGDLKAAQAAADEAIEIAERIDSARLAADGWSEVAENAKASHDPARAVLASRRAIAAVLEMTSGLAEGQGAQAREKYGRFFRLANASAIDLGDAATLFEFAESGRAIEFLASLEQGDSIRSAAVPKALHEAEEAARVAEAEASLRFAAARVDGDRATVKGRQADLDAARAKHEDAINSIRRDVRAASAIYPKSIPHAEARAALGADDALVIYALADERCAALVLTKQEIRLVPLGATKDLAASCSAWDPAADAAKADAAIVALKKALVDPLKLADATKRVLVSPDGDVYRAPLAALFAGREVVHVPSASSYVLLAADRALRGTKVLAVGGPDYTGTIFTALPESDAEAKDVGADGVVVTGKDATEARVRAEIAKETRWRSVHFAVHGVVNERRPMLCGLALTAAAPDDGLLTALDVLQQPVPSDLVVLSACDSGGGRVFAGEGLVGMPRAFLFAGSPRVIASSWKVDDAATRALMTKFYELWRGKGQRASQALAGAQDFVRADERWRHPRFWAAWTLWGIGD